MILRKICRTQSRIESNQQMDLLFRSLGHVILILVSLSAATRVAHGCLLIQLFIKRKLFQFARSCHSPSCNSRPRNSSLRHIFTKLICGLRQHRSVFKNPSEMEDHILISKACCKIFFFVLMSIELTNVREY